MKTLCAIFAIFGGGIMLIKLYEFMPISLRICQHFLLRGDPEEIRVSRDNFCSPHKTTNAKNIGGNFEF